MVFFDLLAAFPILAIAWLFKVLESVGDPEGFRNCASAVYDDLLHFVRYTGCACAFCYGHSRVCARVPACFSALCVRRPPIVQFVPKACL